MGFNEIEADTWLRGQAKVWKIMYAYADSMALSCAIKLGIADIINSHGVPITLSQIASGIDSPSVDTNYLARVMRFLVRKEIFTEHNPSEGGETLYGLNHQLSRWILRDSEQSLVPMILLESNQSQHAPWNYLSQGVKEGGLVFNKAHGCDIWEFSTQNPEYNRIFNDAMACTGKLTMQTFLSQYKDFFSNIDSLVDVGGGTGVLLAEIVKAFPHIKGVNFDLPHVLAMAPTYEGVSHVSGNMFEAIPKADAVFMKWILHDWDDETCVKILQNCRRAIPEKTGKLVIMEIVLQGDNGKNQFGDMGLVYDLVMLTHVSGGKERTEQEWNKLLEEGGFPQYKIINIPAMVSIIEAYPE